MCKLLKVWPHRQMPLQPAGCGSCASAVSDSVAQQPMPWRQAASGQACDGQYLVQDIKCLASDLRPWQKQPSSCRLGAVKCPWALLEDQTPVRVRAPRLSKVCGLCWHTLVATSGSSKTTKPNPRGLPVCL